MNEKGLTVSYGPVHGPIGPQLMVCQKTHLVVSNGVWFGADPLKYSVPLVLLQITLISLTTRLVYQLLRPLRQSMITAQILTGVILGPTLLGRNTKYLNAVLPPDGKVILQTISNIGLVIHLFLTGVRIDTSMLRQVGNHAVLIGSFGYAVSFIFGSVAFVWLTKAMGEIPHSLKLSLRYIVTINCVTSFPVITSLLADLNLLNSELGRLATKVTMVSDLLGTFLVVVVRLSLRDSAILSIWAVLSNVGFVLLVLTVFRPMVIWIARRSTEGDPSTQEIPFIPILLILLGVSLTAEVLGFYAAFGAFCLGIAIPDGPPLGAALVHKLDTMATGLLLPIFIAISGLQTNFFSALDTRPILIELIILLGYLGKFAGTIATGLYCSLQFWDAFSLALIMCCKGIIEVSIFIIWKDNKILTAQTFILLIVTMLLITGIARPLVVYLYDPSKRYKTKSRRTIAHSNQRKIQLRMLVCIHNVDSVPIIIDLLEASNPTRFSPISIFVVHLMELRGRATSILVPHHHLNKLNSNASRSEHVVNAFKHFEQQHQGSVMAQHFTAVAPYATMHNDICTLALDKKATIVIVPFYKQYAIDGSVGTTNHSIRNVNRNVLEKAPCSVGILIDRKQIAGKVTAITDNDLYQIAMLFLGGPDDLEALALCKRMAEHSKVGLTVVHFKHKKHQEEKINNLENQQINDFRDNSTSKDKIHYKEEIVRDGVDTTQVIGSLQSDYDLVMVGRYHDHESPLLLGLSEWSECPELGVIGDMLASPDFHFSVLVVQQQPEGLMMAESHHHHHHLPIYDEKPVDTRVHPQFIDGDCTPIHIRTE